ncbi:response regulator [Neiella marina]|uniref:Response regulator n=1 Tax=Neiella holothuriorum TaxID=2870530 RepID=A0ABS7EDP6_9GAMM|nr:response regulator [Neiella holothuriorum]MBW8190453.1 response regulator [Neiella holothuriorum]
MEKLTVICVDDQPEVLNAVARDIGPLASHCEIEECQSAQECLELLDELDAEGTPIALIISDHVMPDKNGVQMLTEIADDHRFKTTRLFLLTGLATHQDTIMAINKAGIDRYFEKAWDPDELLDECRRALTRYVFATGLDYLEYQPVLDAETTYKLISSS